MVMHGVFYSVEQVAERLGLHVRTVRQYVRDGRLKAVRIGKQYRIAGEDLDTLTGSAAVAAEIRYVEVSSVVGVDGIGADAASHISNGLLAAAKSHPAEDAPLRVDTTYDMQRLRLKVIVTGSILSTTTILKLLSVYLER
jgi:excisionase family DNA binding protein